MKYRVVKPHPIRWAEAALAGPGGWELAHHIASTCYQIKPLDVFWSTALKWLNDRKPIKAQQ